MCREKLLLKALFVTFALSVLASGVAVGQTQTSRQTGKAKLTEAEVEAKLAHLLELCQKNRRAEVVAEFKDADFAAWLTVFKDKNAGLGKIRRALQLRGFSLIHQKEYELAKKDYQYALELSPSDANAWSNLGSIYRRLGDDDKALDAYNKAYECDRAAHKNKSYNHMAVNATLEAASILSRQLNYAGALKTLERYNDDDIPRMGKYWACRTLRAYGQVYLATGQEENAMAVYKAALELERKQD